MTHLSGKSAINAKKISKNIAHPLEHKEPQPYLQIDNVNKNFGQFVALKNIFLDVYPGEFVCLLGPSGCGKTTLLRIIAGLEQQNSGRIIQDGQDISVLPPAMRDFGIVFQSYALFPNLTAAENIAYGLQNAKTPKNVIKTRVEELLTLVGLEEFARKYPAQLSGGQQQRVAIARAIALSPGLLLLDEPLSALDAQVRVKLRIEITQLQKRLGVTTIMVTHDQTEALAMADRIVVMDKGYIAQVGNPQAVYNKPHTPFVANFIGVMNFIDGVVINAEQVRCGNLLLQVPSHEFAVDNAITVAIRPEDIRLINATTADNLTNAIKAEIQAIEYLGSICRVSLHPERNAKELLTVEVSGYEIDNLDITSEASIRLQLPVEKIHIFAQ